MSKNVQSLSICCPSPTGRCINHCKTCTARQHENPYKNKFCTAKSDSIEYWNDVIKRMRQAQDDGCTTVMLTGSNEPQQNLAWLQGLYLAMKSLDKPFNNIEIQTTGAMLNYDFLKMLKMIGVTTVAVSTFNILDDTINREIEESADKNLNIQQLCDNIEELGMNVRICVNVTDYVLTENQRRTLQRDTETEKVAHIIEYVNNLLNRCHELHANQVTFRKMWANEGTPEAEWIHNNEDYSGYILDEIKTAVKSNGTLLNVLPYGAARYDYLGFSIVIDTDSMAKDETNTATKYYIIREDGKMYSSWDSAASIIF
ncbi:radical SAM protein [Sharpea azabuensis]|uniref:radical SAM protein n=1 Tax=Sharpea azabuensis TaxID=322505 RepID=UPI002E812A31|nr:radical SAM protein [Sharpea azabuensis]MEE3309318.1 radical SAM protein [Sharpea azabuensis]